MEGEVGRSKGGRNTSKRNTVLRDLGSIIISYTCPVPINYCHPPPSPASKGDNLHKPRCTFGAN